MSADPLYIAIFLLLAIPVLFLFAPNLSGGLMRSTYEKEVKSLLNAPSNISGPKLDNSQTSVLSELSKGSRSRTPTSTLSIEKRLKYASWPISSLIFHGLEILLSLLISTVIGSRLGIVIQIATLFTGPIILRSMLQYAIDRTYKKFDSDYPQFLLSTVGLLKTGLTPIGALESAAKGLDKKSLVRSEVEILVERMKIGIPEERSIGAFGEHIYHPEIELFVQALLLSRRVGGTLSDTLERLAKQSRKRQFFRSSANAAVGLQRASIWTILSILVAVEMYIYFTYPTLVSAAWYDPLGWMVWQFAIVLVGIAFLWSRQVTNIKI